MNTDPTPELAATVIGTARALVDALVAAHDEIPEVIADRQRRTDLAAELARATTPEARGRLAARELIAATVEMEAAGAEARVARAAADRIPLHLPEDEFLARYEAEVPAGYELRRSLALTRLDDAIALGESVVERRS